MQCCISQILKHIITIYSIFTAIYNSHVHQIKELYLDKGRKPKLFIIITIKQKLWELV